ADFWRIAVRYGGARAGNLLKHRRLTSWRQTVAPAFLVLLLGLAVLSLWDARFLVPLAGITGLYFTTDAVLCFRLARRRRTTGLFARLLIAFPCMHFGWALGFWKRLLI